MAEKPAMTRQQLTDSLRSLKESFSSMQAKFECMIQILEEEFIRQEAQEEYDEN